MEEQGLVQWEKKLHKQRLPLLAETFKIISDICSFKWNITKRKPCVWFWRNIVSTTQHWAVFSLWRSNVLANKRSRYICNVFSQWLRPCIVVDINAPSATVNLAKPPIHDDVIKWKHFPRHWPFVRGIHRSPIDSPQKGQWRKALMFSLMCAWTNGWEICWYAGDLRRNDAHCDVIAMSRCVVLSTSQHGHCRVGVSYKHYKHLPNYSFFKYCSTRYM